MNTVAKKLLFVSMMSIYCFMGLVAQNLSVYVSPHPDDWQLFMNPNAYKQLSKPNQKVIFLHITAGDAGVTDSAYYLAREEGSLRAIRFMANTLYNIGGTDMNPKKIIINGHNIQKFSYANSVAYFLRLPDGGMDGAGLPSRNFQSIKSLYSGKIAQISAIDGSTTYNSLNDLETMLKQLIILELSASDSIQFNLADNDTLVNPNDHMDHLFSSIIMQDVAKMIGNVTINLYQDYITSSKPQNVFGDDYLINAGTWGATNSGLSDKKNSTAWDPGHNSWVGRQYFRVIVSNDTVPPNSPKDTIPPSAPTNLLASPTSPTLVTLSWTASTDNIAVTGYNLYRNGTLITSTTSLTFSDNSVSPGNTYSYTVKSYDAAGNQSLLSQPANITTADLSGNLALDKPTTSSGVEGNNYSSLAVDGDKSLSSWWGANPYPQWWRVDLQSEYYLNKVVVLTYYDGRRYYKYDIQVSLDGTNWSSLVDYNNNTTPATSAGNSFNIDNVKARYIRVNMNYNSANNGVHIIEFEAYGTISNTSGNDSIPPTTPTNLLAVPTSSTSINVSWTASTDNEAVASYHLYRDGTLVTSTSSLSYSDNSLLPGTTYSYTIRSYDATGNQSTLSQPVTVTTATQSANLALNKPATASSYEYQDASYAVNGVYDRWDFWSASPYPQWWKVDLQNEYLLNRVVVFTYYDGSRYYKYDIQVSLDGTSWSPLVDFNNNTTPATATGNSFNIDNVKARYIRVNMNYNSANAGVHIIEFEAYGTLSSTLQSLSQKSVVTGNAVAQIQDSQFLSTYPNPIKEGETINLLFNSSLDERIKVNIYSLTGTKIFGKEVDLVSGKNDIKIVPLKNLKGTFLIIADMKEKREIKKILFE